MIKQMIAATAFAALGTIGTIAVIAPTPALAADRQSHSFVRDGQTYSYDVIQKGGVKVLQGRGATGDFRFEVRGNKVTGTANGEAVSFEMPEAMMGAQSN